MSRLTDDVIQFRQRIADLETQKADLMEHVLNAYEASALTMTLRKTVGYLPDYLRFCGIYGVEHDAIIDKLDYQSFVLARVNNEDLRQDEATCSLVAENEELKRRIAELESKNGYLRTIAHEQNELAIRASLDSNNATVEMGRLHKRIAELEAKLETADKLQDSAFRDGLKAGFSYGQTDDQSGFTQCMSAYSNAGVKVKE